jgi:hypothetical protein
LVSALFFYALTFLAGFSQRFAADVVTSTRALSCPRHA